MYNYRIFYDKVMLKYKIMRKKKEILPSLKYTTLWIKKSN